MSRAMERPFWRLPREMSHAVDRNFKGGGIGTAQHRQISGSTLKFSGAAGEGVTFNEPHQSRSVRGQNLSDVLRLDDVTARCCENGSAGVSAGNGIYLL